MWNEAGNKDARYYIDGALVKGIADILGNTNGDEISIGSIEPCEMYMHAPLVEFTSPTIYFEEILELEKLELPSFGVDVDDDEILEQSSEINSFLTISRPSLMKSNMLEFRRKFQMRSMLMR